MRRQWHDAVLFGLVGLGSGLVAVIATVVLAFGFSLLLAASVVFAMTGGGDLDILISTVEYLFLPLAGALAGLVGGMAGLTMLKRLWQPSRRWQWGWMLAWMLGGMVVWFALWIQRDALSSSMLFIASLLAWILLAETFVAVLLVIAPPWKR
ncbi:MAG: hypothetical protein N2049_07045 [Anaerolineales bacterium]|nr:hypothetical protein [Anaerolineales bacterium]MCX7608957.1 hypothetical protein [Anaerolineales bacterium]